MSQIGISQSGDVRTMIAIIALGWHAAFTAAQCLDDTILSDEGSHHHQDIELIGDTLFVGAHWETSDHGARGVVRVYTHDGQDWIKTDEIASPNSAFAREFGYDIEPISETHILVSDPGDDGGVVWELEYIGNTWELLNQIRPDNPDYYTRFGHAIAASNNDLIIGAPGDDSFSAGPGVVHFYESNGNEWILKTRYAQRVLDDVDWLGWAVDVEGIIALASGRDGSLAYSYRRNSNNWARKGRLTVNDTADAQSFGWTVHLFGDRAAIADPKAGDDARGRVYLYDPDRSGDILPFGHMEPWLAPPSSEFGLDITSRDNWIVIQDSQSYWGSGATYIFRTDNDDIMVPYLAVESSASEDYPGYRSVALDGDWLATAGEPESGMSAVVLHSLRRRCICPADFNEDGSINPADVLAFLNAWNTNNDAADVNQDGMLDTRDVVWFLQIWGQTGSCES